MKSRLAALAFVVALAAATLMSPSIFAAAPPGDGGSTTLPGGGEDPTGSCIWAQLVCETESHVYRGGGTCQEIENHLMSFVDGDQACTFECHGSDLC